MRWRVRRWPRKWDSASNAGGGNNSEVVTPASRSRGQCLARVGTDALDHGAQAIGALWRQVLAEAEFVEHRDGVGGQNLLRGVPGIQRQQDRDQPAHDMRVAVAEVVEQRFVAVAAVELLRQPDLAGGAPHLVARGMLG